MIVDYADPAAAWYADGFAFGLHPLRAGDLLPAADPAAPLQLEHVGGGAARSGLARFAKCGGQREPDSDPESGQVRASGPDAADARGDDRYAGKLWYLVRGPGRAYCGHGRIRTVLVDGPLHGQTLLEWKAKRWPA